MVVHLAFPFSPLIPLHVSRCQHSIFPYSTPELRSPNVSILEQITELLRISSSILMRDRKLSEFHILQGQVRVLLITDWLQLQDHLFGYWNEFRNLKRQMLLLNNSCSRNWIPHMRSRYRKTHTHLLVTQVFWSFIHTTMDYPLPFLSRFTNPFRKWRTGGLQYKLWNWLCDL